MVEDGLADADRPTSTSRWPSTCCRCPAGTVGTRPGPTLSAADSMRITVYGRGAHGSMPQAAVDPVVLAAMIVVRLQTVVAREVAPGETAVLTVGQHPGRHEEQHHPRPRRAAAQHPHLRRADPRRRPGRDRRIVRAECEASGSPEGAGVRAVRPLPAHRQRRRGHRAGRARRSRDFFGDRAGRAAAADRQRGLQRHPDARSARRTPTGASAASTPTPTARPQQAGRVAQDIPVNHSAAFAPVIQPTLDTGTQALVVAAMELARPPDPDLAVHVERRGLAWRSCPTAWRPRPRRTSSSTPTTPSTGGSGAPRRSRRRGGATCRCC